MLKDFCMESIFKRHELKFILPPDKHALIYKDIVANVPRDSYGKYLVQSLYFDTSNWDVIRRSIEKPPYKEKMRLRCYNVPGEDSTIYLELKKKYRGIVYKRRIAFLAQALKKQTAKEIAAQDKSQIGQELDYYFSAHPVTEKAHISYDREAFGSTRTLRITFDTKLRFRTHQLDYHHPGQGLEIIPDHLTIMEIKTLGAMPLWLSQDLSRHQIYPHSFSKVGAGYNKYILKGGNM